MTQLVLDTNVLVSAALGNNFCRKAYEIAVIQYKVLRSSDTFSELAVTLEKPRLQRYLQEFDKIDFLSNYLMATHAIEIKERVYASRDSKDNMFLELALSSSGPTTIVTGDSDLLVLHPFRDVSIISVSDFLSRH